MQGQDLFTQEEKPSLVGFCTNLIGLNSGIRLPIAAREAGKYSVLGKQ